MYIYNSQKKKLKKYTHLNLNEISTLTSGEHLSPIFLKLAKDLDVEEPKLPEDVYKSHLEEKKKYNCMGFS